MNVDIEPVTADPPQWERRTVLRQNWDELAYFHWPYDPADVQRLLPEGVTVDTLDGRAWVGLIPFEMRRVRVGPLPRVPYLGSFIEVNVRTYVTDRHGRRAVWFFSLDVPRSVIVGVARSVFALPYCFAGAGHTIEGDRHRYTLERRWPHRRRPTADIRFEVGDVVPAADIDELDHFLTARWALLATRFGRVRYGAVHHPRWPLHTVHSIDIDQNLIEAAGLPGPVGEPVARYSPGVSVDIGWFETIGD